MLNKPMGVVSTRRDPGGRPTVLDLLEDATGLFPVGRLDADSRGLLLLTTDGELSLRLTHPRHGIRKRYLVAVRGRVPSGALRTLRAGVQLEDGPARALSASVTGERRGDTLVEVEMGEGRRREVRRLCAAAGLVVTDLQRVGFGPLQLGRLAEGASRRLRPAEEAELRVATGLAEPDGGRGMSLRAPVPGGRGRSSSRSSRSTAPPAAARAPWAAGSPWRSASPSSTPASSIAGLTVAAVRAGLDPGDAAAAERLAAIVRIELNTDPAGGAGRLDGAGRRRGRRRGRPRPPQRPPARGAQRDGGGAPRPARAPARAGRGRERWRSAATAAPSSSPTPR